MLVGLFVGGRSRRMRGVPKGTLLVDGRPIVVRTIELATAIGEVVLVGDPAPYRTLTELPALADDPAGIGPLGGLAALLSHAGDRRAIALACDMPTIASEDLARLAADPREAPILAGRRDAWEPLFARYDAPRVGPLLRTALADGIRGFQRFFERCPPEPFECDPRTLVDWDEPEDLP
jgi:molybdopterin-guanine dinucleotide biosynthesis protein A